MNIYRVAFAGKMGVGKSTAVKLLKDQFPGCSYHLLKFADPIYETLEILGVKKKARSFMQMFGDLARSQFGDDIFSRLFAKRYLDIEQTVRTLGDSSLIVCDDLRFIGEAELLRKFRFEIVKIVCSEPIRRSRIGTTWGDVTHRSETELDKIIPDWECRNDLGTEALREFVVEFAETLRHEQNVASGLY